jgi:hypothetical protein
MERTLVVGLWCTHHDPSERPSITEAVRVLQSEDVKLPQHMYSMAAFPGVVSVGESGGSGSSSNGVRSSATTGTTHSSGRIVSQLIL